MTTPDSTARSDSALGGDSSGALPSARAATASPPSPSVSGIAGIANAWKCVHCGCRSYARVDEWRDEGWFSPSRLVRCVNCKSLHAKPDPKSITYRLAYLEEHHHITESLIGIAMMDMTPEQRDRVKPFCDQLSLLHINRLLDSDVPPEEIGSKGIFREDDELVAKAIEARRAETGTGSVHDSAVGAADLPEGTHHG